MSKALQALATVHGAVGVIRALVSALLACAALLWFGLSGAVFVGYWADGGVPGRSLLRLGGEEAFLLLSLLAMMAAARLLWLRRSPRVLWAAVLLMSLAQVTILAYALSLSHWVRSGLAWVDSTWRRFLHELRLPELFAYHGWFGIMVLVAAAVAAAVATQRLLLRQPLL